MKSEPETWSWDSQVAGINIEKQSNTHQRVSLKPLKHKNCVAFFVCCVYRYKQGHFLKYFFLSLCVH